MPDKDRSVTRRSAIKLSAGSLALLVGGVGTTTATSEGPAIAPEVADASGSTEAIVSLSRTPLEVIDANSVDDVAREKIRAKTLESQEPTVSKLSGTDGVTIHRRFWVGNGVFVTIDTDRVDIETDVLSLSDVDAVYDNREIEVPQTDIEPRATTTQEDVEVTYGLEQINSVLAREEFQASGDGATVAVVDTGIDPEHPAHDTFDQANFAEFTLTAEQVDTDPRDPDDHGTHVSGTAAGNLAEDSTGVNREIGVAPDAELLHAKVFSTFDGNTSATTAQVVAGIEWAVDNGADVVNQSLGSSVSGESVFDGFYLEVMRGVVDTGVVPVASAGNNGQGLTGSPGNVRESFSIAANDINRELAGFSSGEQVYSETAWGNDAPDDYPTWYTVPDVSGPGVGVLSSVPGGEYAELSGTSMSAPHVTGAVAQILSADLDLDPLDTRDLLEETAVHPDGPTAEGTEFGVGIVDVLGAVASADGGGVITGTVDIEGESVEGFEIESDFGTRAVTGEDGAYELNLSSGEHEVTFDRFGITTETRTVDIPADGTVEENVSLTREIDVQLRSSQPVEITRGESFDIVVDVANLETLTVGLGEATENINPNNVTLSVMETEFGIGERLPVGGLTDTVPLTVELAPGNPVVQYADEDGIVRIDGLRAALDDLREGEIGREVISNVIQAYRSGEAVEGTGGDGVLALEHTFEGLGDATTVLTGPTDVITGDPATFEIVDSTLPAVTGGDQDADDDPNTVTVSATIENTGDVQGTQDVTYTLVTLGLPFPEPLTIPAGETAEFQTTVSNLVAAGFGGSTLQHGIFTPSDQVVGPLSVPEATGSEGEFLVDTFDAPDSVQAGEPIEVTATIENTRTESFSSLVEYVFDAGTGGAVTPEFRALEVDAESTAEWTFSFETNGILPGEYEHTVSTAQDSETATIVIE